MGSGTFIVDTEYVLGLNSRVNGAKGTLGKKENAKNGTTEAISQVAGLGIVLDCASKFDDSMNNLGEDLAAFGTLLKKFSSDMMEKDDKNIENYETIEGFMKSYADGEHVAVEDNFAQAESGAFQLKMDEELHGYNSNQEKEVTDENDEVPITQPPEESVIEREDVYDMSTENDPLVKDVNLDSEIDVNRENLFSQVNGNNSDVNHVEDATVINGANLYQQDTIVSALKTHNFDSQTESKDLANQYSGEAEVYDYEKNQGESKEKIEYLYDFDNKQYVVNHYTEDGNTLIRKVVIDPVTGDVVNETSFDQV